MNDELRQQWVCLGCDLRVSNRSGRPIPEPAKWEGERCPKCRVDLARNERGKEAADAMEERLGFRRRRPTMAGRAGTETPKPTQPSATVDERKALVKEVVLAHPDWNNGKLAEELGMSTRTAGRYRHDLGLSRRIEVTDEQREAIERALTTEVRKDEDIADEVGIKVSFVINIRKQLGVSSHRTRVKLERERRIAEVAAEHPDWGPKRIAASLKEPLNTIRRSPALNAAETAELVSDPA